VTGRAHERKIKGRSRSADRGGEGTHLGRVIRAPKVGVPAGVPV
jgi:hypothetical protein